MDNSIETEPLNYSVKLIGGDDESDVEELDVSDSISDSETDTDSVKSDQEQEQDDEAEIESVSSEEAEEVIPLSKSNIVKDIDLYKDSDTFYKEYNPKKNILSPKINKYEETCIIGIRTEQLSLGSNTFLNDSEIDELNTEDIVEIAIKEYQLKKLPFIIKRPVSQNIYEYWKLSDLEF